MIASTLYPPFPPKLPEDKVFGIYGANTVIAWGGRTLDRAEDRLWELSNEHPGWMKHLPLHIGVFDPSDADLPLEDAIALIELLK